MADNKQEKPGAGWLARAGKAVKEFAIKADDSAAIDENDYGWGGYDSVSASMLLGSGKRQARSRVQIYEKWHYMAGDPTVGSALGLHVTMALGGHETTGQTVFIESTPDAEKDKARLKIVEELQQDLTELFNRVAPQVAWNGAAFGDAFARTYIEDKVGLVDLYTDEMVFPPLVQAYERGNRTVGYVVSTGERANEKLTIKQMIRLKMPRKGFVPQMRVIEKSIKMALKTDELEDLPVLPSLAGGSFMQLAEEAFDNLIASLSGLIGQRILNSMDENVIGANFEGMTIEQRKDFKNSLVNMLKASKARAEAAVKSGMPNVSRSYHIVPTYSEKQLTSISQFNGTSGASSMSIEDVLLHAKMLAGSLGLDLSMLGFADLLSGGLGDGGFFRTSAQAAERSRLIRVALTQFFHDAIDLHCYAKYGWIFDEADRPYKINYFGSISALENENAASGERKMNATALMVQTMDGLKGLGLDKEAVKQIMVQSMGLDEDFADLLSTAIDKAKPPEGEGGFGGGFGGGEGNPPPDFDKPQEGTAADDADTEE